MKAIHRRWGLQAWALVRALPLETPGHPSAPRGVGGTHCGEVNTQAVAWPPRRSAGRRESGSQRPWLGEAAPQPEGSSKGPSLDDLGASLWGCCHGLAPSCRAL